MLYVSGWLFVRQDPKAWQATVKRQADAALSQGGTIFAIASLAFLAVFREGAETVLFVHALSKTVGGYTAGLIGGLFAAAAALVVLFFVINQVARRLPLRPLFLITSAFLFLMALKFIGQALQEFQEQQFVSYTEFAGSRWLDAIGFNPTLESAAVQLAVIVLAAVTFLVLHRRGRQQKLASQ
jgi:high-affinity iron transporter